MRQILCDDLCSVHNISCHHMAEMIQMFDGVDLDAPVDVSNLHLEESKFAAVAGRWANASP